MTSLLCTSGNPSARVDDAAAALPALFLCEGGSPLTRLGRPDVPSRADRGQEQSYAIHVAVLCDWDDSWMTVQHIDIERVLVVAPDFRGYASGRIGATEPSAAMPRS
jgi:hypothetical protein